ncbi:MAG TPA: peptide chain release factor N(5)-glutamine methyltransferase [Candidatus Limnocylindrales bacterium]|jgi:release factor glutamine methyltransferase
MPDAATVSELVQQGSDRIAASGSGSARLDAELLLGQTLGIDRTGILAHPDAPVGADARQAFEAAISRRERGEPVAYIRGFREFHGLAFATDARALIPRPETELLVDAAISEIVARLTATPRAPGAPALRVVDVGTGTGAIAVSVLATLRRKKLADQVMVIAIDVSADALQLAQENAVGHGVADRMVFVAADLLPYHVEPPYAVVCANLPYVPSGEIPNLGPELAFEPTSALDGGPDGLDVVRRLLDRLPRVTEPDGVALLEIGADQGDAIVREVDERLPNARCTVLPDLAGHPRLVRIELAPA